MRQFAVWGTSIVTAAMLIGCTSGNVGPRLGVDFPISGLSAQGNVTSTSANVGFIGGATFDGYFNDTWGLRADLQIRTTGGEVGFAGTTTDGENIYTRTGTLDVKATLIELPMMFTFKVTDSAAKVVPFFCIGANFAVASSVDAIASGTQIVYTPDETIRGSFAQSTSGQGAGEPTLYFLIAGGVSIPISKSWDLRAEARINQVIVSNDLVGYYVYGPGTERMIAVTVGNPSTLLGLTLGIALHL